jgi:integrase/recombinase XerD
MNNKEMLVKFESYLLTERRVAQNTFQAYQRDLEQLSYFLKERLVTFDTATLQDLKDFLKFLKEDGLKAKSMARKISCFKTFFLYLNQYFDITNPAEQLISPKLESKLPHYLSEKEIELLLKAADAETTDVGFRNKVMLYLLYGTGMRISELTHLKVTQLDFSSGFIVISGKGGKERMIPVPQHMLTLLSQYLQHVYPLLVSKDTLKKTDYLFPSYYGKKLQAITRQSFFMYLKDLTIKAGIKKELSPHQLRHSLATHLLKKGANLRSLQMLLGHEQLATVQIYTHIETSHLRKIYDAKHPRS